MAIFTHVCVGTNDLEKSRQFYDAALAPLGVKFMGMMGDHGLLFCMALTTFVCGFTVMCIHRHAIPFVDSLPRW